MSKTFQQFMTEGKVKKIACLECDEVSTEAAWRKANNVCPKCKKSSKGVAAESLGIKLNIR